MIGRRGFITGLVSLVAAPAIVRVGSIMPVRVVDPFDAERTMRALLDFMERQVNPPYGISPMMENLPYMIEWNAVTREILRTTCQPAEWLVGQ